MRSIALFNDNWYFHDGDIELHQPGIKGPSYSQAKTEHHMEGPASLCYPDRPDDYMDRGTREISFGGWQNVTLPHDFIITQEPKKEYNNAWGFFDYHPGWYRKHFVISSADIDRRIVLYFEGVADKCEVWFNGCDMCTSLQGNTPFEVDITDYIRFDEDNVLAIRVETGTCEGWWYQGGGIYRNVWLEKYDAVSVDRWGAYAYPVKKEAYWSVPVETEVRNDSFDAVETEVAITILAPDGTSVKENRKKVRLAARSVTKISFDETVTDPVLWDIDAPNLYTLKVNAADDETRVSFGFRDLRFDPDTGFWINGRNVKLKGVCGHGDCGLTGRAVPDSMYRYKAQLIKDMGANAYRCSHYPQAEYWMDEMDRKGILVMDEVRWFSSTPDGIRQLETLIKRDRNHPSVILWSVGNEEPFFITSQGARIARSMYAAARKLDTNRPIITANDKDPSVATVYDQSDIVGINYHLEMFDPLHKKFPDKAIFSTENSASGTTRDWYYEDDPALGKSWAIDHDVNDYFIGRTKTWKFIMARPWLMGGMQWIGFEHRGEAMWPCISSKSGAVDLYLQKKDAFYQNKSLWDEKPMIHLMPHWNWEYRTGENIDVYVYTNCDEAELFLNGRSLGREKHAPYETLHFSVPYERGTLSVKGYVNGTVAAQDERITSGKAVALQLRAENADDVSAGDALLLTCFAVDSESREVPTASPLVRFTVSKNAEIIATGSETSDHVPPQEPVRKMYMGKISVLVRKKNDDPLTVTALADDLLPAKITL